MKLQMLPILSSNNEANGNISYTKLLSKCSFGNSTLSKPLLNKKDLLRC